MHYLRNLKNLWLKENHIYFMKVCQIWYEPRKLDKKLSGFILLLPTRILSQIVI